MQVRRALVFLGAALILAAGCGRLVNDGESTPVAAVEAGSSVDSGVVATGTDGGAVDLCAGATFCDGFERSADVKGPWDDISASNNGSVTLTTERAAHGTSALRVTLAPDNDSTGAVHEAKGSLPPGSRIRVSFAIYIDTLPSRSINIGLLNFTAASRGWGVLLVLDPTGLHVFETDSPWTYGDDHGAISPPPVGHWVPVTIDLALATPGRVTATIDGTTVATNVQLRESYSYDLFGNVALGSEFASQSATPTILDFDDVRIDVVP